MSEVTSAERRLIDRIDSLEREVVQLRRALSANGIWACNRCLSTEGRSGVVPDYCRPCLEEMGD